MARDAGYGLTLEYGSRKGMKGKFFLEVVVDYAFCTLLYVPFKNDFCYWRLAPLSDEYKCLPRRRRSTKRSLTSGPRTRKRQYACIVARHLVHIPALDRAAITVSFSRG